MVDAAEGGEAEEGRQQGGQGRQLAGLRLLQSIPSGAAAADDDDTLLRVATVFVVNMEFDELHFLTYILISNRSILKTVEELRAAVIDLLGRLNREGVVYAEVRLCPALHTLEGLTEQQVGANSEGVQINI